MWTKACVVLLLLFCTDSKGAKHSKEAAKDGIESLTLRLEHAIGSGEFSERGVASVKSLKSSITTMSLSQSLLTHTLLEDIKLAAVAGGVYRLRAPTRLREGLTEEGEETEEQRFVSTTISACSLVKSHLSDIIKVIGDGRGNVIGLTVTTLPTSQATDCTSADAVLSRSFNTSILLDNGSRFPGPMVEVFLKKKEEEEEREKRVGKDDRSFFQKYWIYILIGVFIIMTLNGAGQAAGGGGGGGGGG